jgi:hydrogenase maturation protein HypF
MNCGASDRIRLKACVRGTVQGVGFRPFIFRLATELGLTGWVNNSPQGVFLEVEGPRAALEGFLLHLETGKPPPSFIQSLEASWLDPVGYAGFEIRQSETSGDKSALVLPDIATCPACLREVLDSNNRRYRYPFTNCTHCGPRFSIIEALPYDRANTSMKSFTMCLACQAEYADPRDRRFHAQPNACPACGPHLELWNPAGEVLSTRNEALLAAVDAIRHGQIVAVKGLGGFHLMVAAHDDAAVCRLRERKQREEKPLALMFPSLERVKVACEVTPLEERLLRSPEAPIVLLRRHEPSQISNLKLAFAESIAPKNPNLGVMLPYTPLHHLLLAELGYPVVATSGNLSDEPICTDEREALKRLGGIAGLFLVHNRAIFRHVDDSIVRVALGRELVLRRARGYAPLPITLKSEIRNPKSEIILAVGAHLKNAVALSVGQQVFISQHIGDLETAQSFSAFQQVIADFQKLYEVHASTIASDLHPDYLSTRFAQEKVELASASLESTLQRAGQHKPSNKLKLELQPRHVGVQHHIAHVLSCMADNELEPPALGVAWDGTGYGLDGTVWGGEFFLVTAESVERVAHLRPFRLPGGDKAVKEPRRTALGLLYEIVGDEVFKRKDAPPATAFSEPELVALKTMFLHGLNSPWTSSVGRLFDAVASLVSLRQQIHFEGQAAMELEFALVSPEMDKGYPLSMASQSTIHHPQSAFILDWSPMISKILADVGRRVPVSVISAKFHNALAEGIVTIAKRIGQSRVVLSGGCFQNRYLTERTVRCLREEGFRPYWHQRVPPNDGGIALGQIVAARRNLELAK